ncbi:MAG: DUF4956 domain-containing protein [Lachnospiraceae bacterium]|nr:DUF4956 domain-containing protein [Lachnospiraceae bacterium]
MFQSILNNNPAELSVLSEIICLVVSMVYGLIIALVYMFRTRYSKSFVTCLVILPALVQVVMMLVNGNLGASVAILGAFSLVRYRSVPGSAKEITAVFFAMAVGLATGMGYVVFAGVFVVCIGLVFFLLNISKFGEHTEKMKTLKILIPENLDYNDIFDAILEKYTSKFELIKVRTTDLGSLFELTYQVIVKDEAEGKAFIDELRTKNGNLNVVLSRGRVGTGEEL